MTLTKVRTVQMFFYQDDEKGAKFKVWEAASGGWWVDQVDEAGETQSTLAFAETVQEAEAYMAQWEDPQGADYRACAENITELMDWLNGL